MSGNYTDVREMSGISLKVVEMSGNCQGKNLVMEKCLQMTAVGLDCYLQCTLVNVEDLTCVSYVVEMRTEDCVTFIIFHYSVAVDGTSFYDVIIMKLLSLNMNLTV